MFERVRNFFFLRSVDLEKYVDLQGAAYGRPTQEDIDGIELGDYIMWTETSGSPGDPWYCGRSCDGLVSEITPQGFAVVGVGYYRGTPLWCSKTPTTGAGYAPSSHGVGIIIKKANIRWKT